MEDPMEDRQTWSGGRVSAEKVWARGFPWFLAKEKAMVPILVSTVHLVGLQEADSWLSTYGLGVMDFWSFQRALGPWGCGIKRAGEYWSWMWELVSGVGWGVSALAWLGFMWNQQSHLLSLRLDYIAFPGLTSLHMLKHQIEKEALNI